MPKEGALIQGIVFASILFASVTGVIISLFVLYQRKKRHHEMQIQAMEDAFTSSKIEIQRDVMKYVSGELHDNFAASLAVINIELAGLRRHVPPAWQADIEDLKAMVKQLMADMRALSVSVNPDYIIKKGLASALEKHAGRIARSGNFALTFETIGIAYQLPEQKQIILFRMCQEILNNILKHAGCTGVVILLAYEPGTFKIEIADNGCGFDMAKQQCMAEEKESAGLSNLQHRALIMGARLTFDSAEGMGTRVKIWVENANELK